MRFGSRILGAALVVAVLSLGAAGTASADSFLVEQWFGNGAGSGRLSGSDSVIAGGAADVSAIASSIDFGDGYNYPGSYGTWNAWPGASTQNDYFVARISAYLTVATAGTYYFQTYNDDGLRLSIDGIAVITDNYYHGPKYRNAGVYLTAGTHYFETVFFEGAGAAVLELGIRAGDSGSYVLAGTLAGTSFSAVSAVPEPGTLALIGLGLLGVGLHRRRQRRARTS